MRKLQPPPIHEIENLHLPAPQIHHLANGIPVYETCLGSEEVLKIEVVFQAGRPFERKKLASRATAQMLKEGTRSYTGAEIAETFDFYGASLSTPVNLDFSSVLVFSLKKYFDQLLPILSEMLSVPTFPERELNTYVRRSKQKLAIDLCKNDVVAYRTVTEKIFGESHFYGFNSSADLYDALTCADLQEHFDHFYGSENCQIFLSGKTDDHILRLLDDSLGQVLGPKHSLHAQLPDVPISTGKLRLPGVGELQAAIRIGRRTFNHCHADYCGLFVLNTLFGGYFGSRLMANIREESGLTYNIGSTLDPMRYDGCLYVGTEVSTDKVDESLREIYTEMKKLADEPVKEDELLMVRRYLLGNMLPMLDGPFNVSETIKTLVAEGAPEGHFDHLVHTIKTISARELQELAQRYLRAEDMWEVIVG
jgi:predicted Zn-dependent peptidase